MISTSMATTQIKRAPAHYSRFETQSMCDHVINEKMRLSTSLNACLLYATGALFGYGLLRCQFTSTHEAVYLEQIYFNKVLLGQYNSTLGKVIGYTEKTKRIADDLNKNLAFLKQERKNEEKCKTHIPLAFDVLSRPGDLKVETLIMLHFTACKLQCTYLVCMWHHQNAYLVYIAGQICKYRGKR